MMGKRVEGEETPPEVTPAADGESFGTWLRRQREGRQIALREIADASKISLRYLQALEADRFEILPAAVFAKGFLRQYARYVGLDPEEVINFYLSARQAADDEEEDDDEATTKSGAGGLMSGWKLIVLILLLLGIVVLLFQLNERRRAAGEPQTAVPAVAAPGPSRPAVSLSTNPPAETAPSSVVSTTTAAASEPASAASAAPAAGDADQPRKPIRVTLDFTSECWVQARVDGDRALSETRIQGESLHLEADRSVELTFGDGGAVAIEVNGRPYPLEADPGRVVRLTLDLDSVASLASAEGP